MSLFTIYPEKKEIQIVMQLQQAVFSSYFGIRLEILSRRKIVRKWTILLERECKGNEKNGAGDPVLVTVSRSKSQVLFRCYN